MDPLLLSRLQFAMTIGFHYIFAPITIGMGWMIVWFQTRHLTTGDEAFRTIARFWIRVFALSFAVGVATGITMEFQFGMNWARYSRFVGDIFGVPLAAEGIFSFFLESSFLGLLLFGERRVPATPWTNSTANSSMRAGSWRRSVRECARARSGDRAGRGGPKCALGPARGVRAVGRGAGGEDAGAALGGDR